ncbi:MAG: hypothetical protein NXH75_17510 [Halobacteriovoraceae bacterium]|nr:hypothetical protein [Halobacteriovoraceae bacterium]
MVRRLSPSSKRKLILTFGSLFLIVTSAHAKFRAREHFDYVNLKYKNNSYTYRGLSNTINYFFKETPKKESYGLGLSTLGNNVENKNLSTSPFGESINLYQVDFEFKYFLKDYSKNFYLRHGTGLSFLESDKNFFGVHLQQAIGYEVPFKHFGLAWEFSAQYGFFEKGLRMGTIGAAIGFHFYKML